MKTIFALLAVVSLLVLPVSETSAQSCDGDAHQLAPVVNCDGSVDFTLEIALVPASADSLIWSVHQGGTVFGTQAIVLATLPALPTTVTASYTLTPGPLPTTEFVEHRYTWNDNGSFTCTDATEYQSLSFESGIEYTLHPAQTHCDGSATFELEILSNTANHTGFDWIIDYGNGTIDTLSYTIPSNQNYPLLLTTNYTYPDNQQTYTATHTAFFGSSGISCPQETSTEPIAFEPGLTHAIAPVQLNCAGDAIYGITILSNPAGHEQFRWSLDFGDGSAPELRDYALDTNSTYPITDTIHYNYANALTSTFTASHTVHFQTNSEGISCDPVITPQLADFDGIGLNASIDYEGDPCTGQSIIFSGEPSNFINYTWNFGYDDFGTGQTIAHTFSDPGQYIVGVSITDGVCSDYTEIVVDIYDTPTPTMPTLNGCLGENVAFPNTSSGGGTFVWDFGDGNSATQFSPVHVYASAGTYTADLTQTNGCGTATSSPATITIGAAPAAAFSASTPLCITSDAAPTFTPVSGTTYTWAWGDGSTDVTTTPSHFYTAAGDYTITLTANNGNCETTSTQLITVLPEPVITVGLDGGTTLCPGQTTSIFASLNDWNPAETYTWSWIRQSDGAVVGNSGTLVTGEADTYTAQLGSTCPNVSSPPTTISVVDVPTPTLATTVLPSCGALNNGEATVTFDPGSDLNNIEVRLADPLTVLSPTGNGYTYPITGLAAGTYVVEVENTTAGCQESYQLQVDNDPTVLVVDNIDRTQPDCGSSNGAIVPSISGGATPYTYLWSTPSTGATTASVTGLSPGSYSLSVTDNNGCELLLNDLLLSEPLVLVDVANTTACGATAPVEATATIIASEGNTTSASWTFDWGATYGGPQTSNANTFVQPLPVGSHDLTVTANDNNCSTVVNVAVLPGTALTLTLTPTQPTCITPGALQVAIAEGGASPLTYSWNTGDAAAELSGLQDGTYTVTVTDGNGCSSSGQAMLNPASLLDGAVATAEPCSVTVQIQGNTGVSPYTYALLRDEDAENNPGISFGTEALADGIASTTHIFTNVRPGSYKARVTDASGCETFTNIEVVPGRNTARTYTAWYRFSEPDVIGDPEGDPEDPIITDLMEDAVDELYDQLNECNQTRTAELGDMVQQACYSAEHIEDELSIGHEVTYHHYTLYYYDRAGQLTKTVPPAGVVTLDPTNSSVIHREAATAHTLETHYAYNTLGELVEQTTPDGGTTKFVYDKLGRLRFSQNARQRAYQNPAYSYTRYDKLGRITEVGEHMQETANIFDNGSKAEAHANNGDFPDNPNIIGTEKLLTTYSQPAEVNYFGRPQRFLNNKISYVISDLDGRLNTTADQTATYYSYDPHGNVEWMIQDLPGFTKSYIAYDYDLVSGNVLKVRYNEERPDRFFHRYEYDSDNRITNVFTSRDDQLWTCEANYDYYRHGPVKRTELGQDSLQGIDYTYTIQGWLKAINHPDLVSTHANVTADGANEFVEDAFGMSLGYFSGDFERTGSQFNQSQTEAFASNDLYNGNIRSWAMKSVYDQDFYDPTDGIGNKVVGRSYTYDQLNRIASSTLDLGSMSGNKIAYLPTVHNDQFTAYTYDGNGNLQSLTRNGTTPTDQTSNSSYNRLDQLQYEYYGGTNRLKSVTDLIATTNGLDAAVAEDFDGLHRYVYDDSGNLIEEMEPDPSDPARDIRTTIEWSVAGKVLQVLKESIKDGGDEQFIRQLNFLYDANGNRVMKSVYNSDPESRTSDPSVNTRDYYLRDAQGNIMSVYTRDVDNGVSAGKYTVNFRVKEVPIYGSDRLGQLQPSAHDDTYILYSVNDVSARDLEDIDFEVNHLLVNSELVHWLAPRNAGLEATDIGTDRYCDCLLDTIAFDSAANTATPGILTQFMGIGKNSVAVAESNQGTPLLYALTTSEYLGQDDVNATGTDHTTLILDANGDLIDRVPGVLNASPESKPMFMRSPDDENVWWLFTVDNAGELYRHTIDLSEQGFAASGQQGGKLVAVNEVLPSNTNIGRHLAAVEDRSVRKHILYAAQYVPPTTQGNLGRTDIIAHYFNTNSSPVPSGVEVLASVDGLDPQGLGELQLSKDGQHLLLYVHEAELAGFNGYRDVKIVSMTLGADRTSIVPGSVLEVQQVGGNLRKGSVDGTLSGTAIFNQQGIVQFDPLAANPSEGDRASFVLDDGTASRIEQVYADGDIRRSLLDRVLVAEQGHVDELSDLGTTGVNNGVTSLSTASEYLLSGGLPGQLLRIDPANTEEGCFSRKLGIRRYELKDHLGNVRVVLSDKRWRASGLSAVDVVSLSDYYPFGYNVPGRSYSAGDGYRYGFQGQELDDEWNGAGNMVSYKYRIHDARIGRFLSVDPLAPDYPWNSPYVFSENTVIAFVELEGLETGLPAYMSNGNWTSQVDNAMPTVPILPSNLDVTPPDFNIVIEGETNFEQELMIGGILPGSGEAIDFTEMVLDFKNGEYGWGIVSGVGLIIPFVPGKVLKKVLRGGKSLIIDGTKNIVRYGDEAFTLFPCGCFTANTLVLNSDSLIPIQNLKAGDKIMSLDTLSDSLAAGEITNAFTYVREGYFQITIAGDVIQATNDHPFYTEGSWRTTDSLKVGDSLHTASGDKTAIESIVYIPQPVQVYNLSVHSHKTFFVGKQQVLVHNGPCDFFGNLLPNRLKSELSLAERLNVDIWDSKSITDNLDNFDELIQEGPLKFAVNQQGELKIMPHTVDGQQISHAVLTEGNAVKTAGQMQISGNAQTGYYIVEFSNHSGHFHPSEASLEIAREKLKAILPIKNEF